MYIHLKQHLHITGKIFFTIILLTICEFLALIAVARIPQKHIALHANESADILLENPVFFYVNEKDFSSRIDRYADSILLNIAYSYDSNSPVESVLRSSYYHTDTQNENDNLKTTITKHTSPNTDYIRYWHGSNIIIKPLLLIMNINGIYILNAIIIIILTTILLVLLGKRIRKECSICFLLACIAVSAWYVPFSLEYTWTFIIMEVASILSFFLHKKSTTATMTFFVVVGNITAYFDFLSTETLTFLLPITCILLMQHKENLLPNTKAYLSLSFKFGISWLVGYICAWIMKWTIASIVLQQNAFKLALQQVNTRIQGTVDSISGLQQVTGALTKNSICLFPFSYLGENAILLFCIILCLLALFYYFFRKQSSTDLLKILFLIALVPYIRFILLSNHSYIHYFFTFRAQLASVFACFLILIYGIDYSLIQKEWRKLWKQKK